MSNCDYYYASRKKSTYSSIGASAYMDDELGVMVTLPLVAQTLGISMEAIGDKLSVDGKETDIMCVVENGYKRAGIPVPRESGVRNTYGLL